MEKLYIDLCGNDECEKKENFSSLKNKIEKENHSKFEKIKEIYKKKEINGFLPFNLNKISNSINIFQTQNFSDIKNNSNFNSINIINNDNLFPSLINNISDDNKINEKNTSKHIFFSKNQIFEANFSENLRKSVNNINNIENIRNINNNYNSQEDNFQNIKNINNINNININNLFQNINQNFNKNNNYLNFTNNNKKDNLTNNLIFDEIEQILKKIKNTNPEYNENINFLKQENYNNKNNPSSSLFFGKKKNICKKKKNTLFKNNKNIFKENIKEKDIRDFNLFCEGLKCSLPEYICSQIGSRIMQKYLNRFPSFIITNLIEKIYMDFEKMMCDIYGNYFCQKLYIISSIEQRRMILNSIKNIFINVSKTTAGAHVSQSIIEESSTKEEKAIIMSYVKGHEMELALHPEGTHVLQKIIQIFPENERQNLTDILCTTANVKILCQDLKGISVIKRLISFNTENINKIKLAESFYGNCFEISKTSSGSYIIQFLIEQWGVEIGIKIILFCIANFELFSISKHSSNLIDKIITICIKKYSIIRYFGNEQNMNFINNEIIIINALKNIILEPNKIINVYKNKYGKALIIKIRKLFNPEENEKLYLFIKSLETVPNYVESKKYKMYIEIYQSQ